MNKVLIVDDAKFMRVTLKNIIKDDFVVVGEASDGREAVKLYEELKPNIVTLDITMPNKDGIEALKEIKKIDPGAKVIMCSAMGQRKMVFKAVKNGAKDFLVKPFKKEDVKKKLKELL